MPIKIYQSTIVDKDGAIEKQEIIVNEPGKIEECSSTLSNTEMMLEFSQLDLRFLLECCESATNSFKRPPVTFKSFSSSAGVCFFSLSLAGVVLSIIGNFGFCVH